MHTYAREFLLYTIKTGFCHWLLTKIIICTSSDLGFDPNLVYWTCIGLPWTSVINLVVCSKDNKQPKQVKFHNKAVIMKEIYVGNRYWIMTQPTILSRRLRWSKSPGWINCNTWKGLQCSTNTISISLVSYANRNENEYWQLQFYNMRKEQTAWRGHLFR